MNKHTTRVLTLALLGACASAAHAQSTVQVYGLIDAGIIKRTDQRVVIGKRANNTLGFKGVEDLGDGLRALFQLEIRYEPDTGTIEQGAGGVQRPLFQGQSRVGLQGAFGTVRIGRGLTAFQESSIAFEPFHGVPSPVGFQTDMTVAGYTSDPLGLVGNSTNRFSNALFYNSPELAGFQLNATVGTRESSPGSAALIGRGTPSAPQFGPGANAAANPYSVSGTYKSGPLALMAALEQNAVETRLYSLAASYLVLPDLKLMASRTRQDRGTTMGNNEDVNAWVLGANYTIGAGKILAGYGQKDAGVLNASAQKTKQYSLGYEHSLSKRTYVYADASQRRSASTTPTHLSTVAIGVNHSF